MRAIYEQTKEKERLLKVVLKNLSNGKIEEYRKVVSISTVIDEKDKPRFFLMTKTIGFMRYFKDYNVVSVEEDIDNKKRLEE